MASKKKSPPKKAKPKGPAITFASTPSMREERSIEQLERLRTELERQCLDLKTDRSKFRRLVQEERTLLELAQVRKEPTPCSHENVRDVDPQDKGRVHWCCDCGAIQQKPGGPWRKPTGLTA